MNGMTRFSAVKHAACTLAAIGMIIACGWMINEVLITPMSPWAETHTASLVSYPAFVGR